MPKTIEQGEEVMVQREVDEPWETAHYSGRVVDIRGWHRVVLPTTAPPKTFVHMGHEYITRTIIVPSRRLRRSP